MKKSLIALAVLAAAGAASAQSSVTLFGVVDTAVTFGRGSIADKTAMTSGNNSTSRIGFRGEEDLGGGLKAGFWLEGALATDDGSAGQRIPQGNQAAVHAADGAGLVFNRRSTLSLMGSFGEVRLGRTTTAQTEVLSANDPFGSVGAAVNLMASGGPGGGLGVAANAIGLPSTRGTVARASNSISYYLPANLGGIYGQAQYFLGENLSNAGATKDDGTGYALKAGFASGKMDVAVAYVRTKFAQTATMGTYTSAVIGGGYDFGVVKLTGAYESDKRGTATGIKGTGWMLGAQMPVGPGLLKASYNAYKIDNGPGVDPSTRMLALGYVHNLSKRTALYATYARASNKDGAAYSVGGSTTAANQSSTGMDLGVRHSF